MNSRRNVLIHSLGAITVIGGMTQNLIGVTSALAAESNGTKLKVAVFGATGRTGSRVVDALVAAGHSVRGISRKVAEQKPRDGVEWVAADVRDAKSLKNALTGVDAAIYAVGVDFTKVEPKDLNDTYNIGVANVAARAKEVGLKRLILLSSAGRVETKELPPEYRASMEAKANGEAALRASGIAYTIVRTPGIWDRPGGEYGILMWQGEVPPGGPFMINRTDIAAVLVECATTGNADRKTFTIMNALSFEVGVWRTALSKLKAD